MIAMAKKKAAKAEAGTKEMTTRGIRMSREYVEWLEELAKQERFNISTLIDRAVADYARNIGFRSPPERGG